MWSLKKIASYVDVDDVVADGAKHLHGAAAATFANGALRIEFVDAPIVNVGQPMGFPTPLDATPDWREYGVSSMVFNNLWNTNYIMWQPYRKDGQDVPNEGNYKFRYNLSW